jgi:hypothetical protein
VTAAASDTITIPDWANGPDGSGNGGWSAGLLAEQLGDEPCRAGVVVDLRVPPPIGRPLEVHRGSDPALVELQDDEVLVASARADAEAASFAVPGAVLGVGVGAARAASSGFPFREHHPFPRCVSCGTARGPGQVALGLHCGPVAGTRVGDAPVFADTWTPDADVADPSRPAIASLAATWSALDCPSAAPVADPDAQDPIVLARLAARVAARPRLGEPHVLAAWHVSSDGRKHVTRSAMLDASGEVLAAAQALWIEVRPR